MSLIGYSVEGFSPVHNETRQARVDAACQSRPRQWSALSEVLTEHLAAGGAVEASGNAWAFDSTKDAGKTPSELAGYLTGRLSRGESFAFTVYDLPAGGYGWREPEASQPGPPTEEARERRDIEWLRVSQLRFLEGYRARMAEPHPMRKNAKGDSLNQRESKWSFAELAEEKCPGSGKLDFVTERKSFQVARTIVYEEPAWPAHERERWIAGFLHADNLAATEGTHAMERADPSKPPPRKKRETVAEPIEAFPDAILDRAQMRERKAADERRRERDLYERRRP